MVHQTVVSGAAQPAQHHDQGEPSSENGSVPKSGSQIASDEGATPDASSEHKQLGVKQVESITTVWSRELLIVMFALLYLVTFVDALLKGVQDSLTPYVTSSFSQHGLLATTSILSTVLGGVCNLTIAKVIDI